YPFSGSNALDVSKDDFIAGYWRQGRILSLLRPKWQGTGVKELLENKLSYTFNNGILRIQFEQNLMVEPEINIYNILGMNVGARHAVPLQQGNTIEINIDYMPSGVFFVVVDAGMKKFVLKIMK
ncbi:T9SS type A sorting domain-containing protein, partial [Bacteroidota bacterium]